MADNKTIVSDAFVHHCKLICKNANASVKQLTNIPKNFVTLSSKNGRGISRSKAQPNLRKMNQKTTFQPRDEERSSFRI